MPSTTDEIRAEWPGGDGEALMFLEKQGYRLTSRWTWHKPTPTHEPTEREWSALVYLVEEWDYGGLEDPYCINCQKPKAVHADSDKCLYSPTYWTLAT